MFILDGSPTMKKNLNKRGAEVFTHVTVNQQLQTQIFQISFMVNTFRRPRTKLKENKME